MRSLLFLVVACRHDPTTPIVADTPSSETGDTGTTPPPAPKIVAEARFRAFVAWDAAVQQVVDPRIDGAEGNISGYMIDLYVEGAYQAGDADGTCQIVLPLTGSLPSANAQTEGFVWGIDLPAGDKPAFDRNCVEKGFDPTNFVGGDPAATWGAPDWRFRLGGPLAQGTIDWLSDVQFELFVAQGVDAFAAGDWGTDAPPPGVDGLNADLDQNFWYAYAMDDLHNVDFSVHPSLVDLTAGGSLATGYYVFDQSAYFQIGPAEPATTPATP